MLRGAPWGFERANPIWYSVARTSGRPRRLQAERFLVKRPLDKAERQRIHVLLDWPSLLN